MHLKRSGNGLMGTGHVAFTARASDQRTRTAVRTGIRQIVTYHWV